MLNKYAQLLAKINIYCSVDETPVSQHQSIKIYQQIESINAYVQTKINRVKINSSSSRYQNK